MDYFDGKGLTVVRLAFRWERVQRTLYGSLDSSEISRIDSIVSMARQRNMRVLLNPHNFARYNGNVIGSSAVPVAAFADFWRKMADRYKGESAIYGYDLTNEPHDMNGVWPSAAQAAINAIRQVDTSHTIVVPGDEWSSAGSWPEDNDGLKNLTDSANNLMFEAHLYFDEDHSGQYAGSYDEMGTYPNIGVDRVSRFVNWLKANNKKGFVGEYGVPNTDSRWLTVLDNTLSYLNGNGVGGAYWAAGPWWGDYPLSVEPTNGQDRAQMSVISKYVGNCPW
jgi:endoglucanase